MENQMVVHDKQTSLQRKPLNSTISLINTLQISNGLVLTENESTSIAMNLIKLDFDTVLYADKIFQASQTVQGKKDTFKIISALLTFFSQATKVKQQLSSPEIIMCTDWIMRTYTHDSVEDIALALKDAVFSDRKFYGAVTVSDVRAIISDYMTSKYERLEKVHKNKVNDPSTFMHSPAIALLLHKSTDDVDNYVSFVEVFDKEKRAKVAKQNAETLARLPKIREQIEFFQAVEKGVVPAYEIVIDDEYNRQQIETQKFINQYQKTETKKYGWHKD